MPVITECDATSALVSLGSEKRNSLRKLITLQAALSAGGATVEGTTVDLSQGGACFVSPVRMPEGMVARLLLRQNLGRQFPGAEVHVRVAYCILGGAGGHNGFRVGLQFRSASPGAMAAITDLLV